jgi:hypothetical protein
VAGVLGALGRHVRVLASGVQEVVIVFATLHLLVTAASFAR